MGFFSHGTRRQVGIDIGTSSIKAAELSEEGGGIALKNYGIIDGLDFMGKAPGPARTLGAVTIPEDAVAGAIRALLSSSRIETKEAVFTVPIFSSFLTVIELPLMGADELERAVGLQVKSYIPVPLSEVVLDWLAIPPETPTAVPQVAPAVAAVTTTRPQAFPLPISSTTQTASTLSVLLVAIPKEVIQKYERIAAKVGITMSAVESESFSMLRSLIGNDPSVTMIVDFGARSTTLTIVDKGFIRLSHTVDLAGEELTEHIAHGMNISSVRAEALKKSEGVETSASTSGVSQLITPSLQKLTTEYDHMAQFYATKRNKQIERIVLAGGSAKMPGLVEYLQNNLGVPISLGNPFARLSYPRELEKLLTQELSPVLAVATGAAMRAFE